MCCLRERFLGIFVMRTSPIPFFGTDASKVKWFCITLDMWEKNDIFGLMECFIQG